MEYVITTDGPFQEIEARTIEALQRGGFVVQRTFRFAPAAPDGDSDGDGHGYSRQNPGYTVLMLHRAGPQQHPLGMVTLYGRDGQAVLKLLLPSPATGEGGQPGEIQDVEAELAVALSLGGLDFCVHAAGGSNCVDPDGLTGVER
jgi:hypothetical protein